MLVIGCDRKLSVSRIQTRQTYLLLLQAWRRLRRGFCLGVHTCSSELVVLIDQNGFKFNQKRLYLLIVNCIFALIESSFIDPDTCPRVWYKMFCGTYLKRTCRFASPSGLSKVVARVLVCDCTCHHQLIYCLHENNTKSIQLIVVLIFPTVEVQSMLLIKSPSSVLQVSIWVVRCQRTVIPRTN